MSKGKLVKRETTPTERIEQEGDLLEIGQWYWVSDRKRKWVVDGKVAFEQGSDEYEEDEEEEEDEEDEEEGHYEHEDYEWLGCVTKVGSNYLRLTSVHDASQRVHFDEILTKLRREHNPKAVIDGEVNKSKARVEDLMGQVKELTNRLGVSPRLGLPAPPQEATTTALVTMSNAPDINEYKAKLIRAKDKELPDLFEEIREANADLATWMKAETIPLSAMAGNMKGAIGEIEGRIFNVSLYAGLTEDVELVRKGKPAHYDEPLRLMQRRLYMDEECLLDYQTGGMDITTLKKFDKWLSKRKNLDRIFPYPRCMVAFRVRGSIKKRSGYGHFSQLLINIQLDEWDEKTFLYIRNGKRLYRMMCDLEFGEWIFPSREEFQIDQPLMLNMYESGSEWITLSDYEQRCGKEEVRKRASKLWFKANPLEAWKAKRKAADSKFDEEGWWVERRWKDENPHYEEVDAFFGRGFNPDNWRPFDSSNIYYDDATKAITKRIQQYNRIVLIIQGLFDRSEVLHPHPPAKLGTPDGFAAAVELVYDGSNCLYAGKAPSFKAYVARCNESIDENSVLMGQDGFWERAEAVKENNRRDNSWHHREEGRVETYRPYGNPGPGYIAKPSRWQKRARKATFVWTRERQTWNRWAAEGKQHGDPIRTAITVPVEFLFNVSTYKPGDYLQFFEDPRTRQKYLRWAPVLLAAEEYYAGNVKAQEPWTE